MEGKERDKKGVDGIGQGNKRKRGKVWKKDECECNTLRNSVYTTESKM